MLSRYLHLCMTRSLLHSECEWFNSFCKMDVNVENKWKQSKCFVQHPICGKIRISHVNRNGCLHLKQRLVFATVTNLYHNIITIFVGVHACDMPTCEIL